MKTKLTISRYWNHPKITTTITKESISLQTDFSVFVEALKAELGVISYSHSDKEELAKIVIDMVGKITWKFSQKEFEILVRSIVSKIIKENVDFNKHLDKTIKKVLLKIQEASTEAIH